VIKTNKMADLLFPLIVPQMRERRFRQQEFSLDEFSDEELRSRYRFGSQSIEYLTEIIGDDLQRQTKRNHAITPTLQILVALRFLASGSFLQVIDDTFGLPKSTVSRIVTDVTLALAHKQSEFIVWPSDPVEMHEVKRGFFDKGGFPGVVGCIDGTHVRIQGPNRNENDYVNRKGYHSINVQAVCNHKGRKTKRHLMSSCFHSCEMLNNKSATIKVFSKV